MNKIIIVISGLLFIASAAAYIFVRLRLKPKDNSDLNDYYCEFENIHPEYAKYLKWSKITFSAAIIAMLLMFLGLMI